MASMRLHAKAVQGNLKQGFAKSNGIAYPRSSSLFNNARRVVTAASVGNDQEDMSAVVSSTLHYSSKSSKVKPSGNPVSDFVTKVQLAWKIFFPDKPKDVSPKEEVKRRLRMVLVADRVGMSPASLSEMKKTIIKALQDFVDIEGEEGIEVSITSEPGLGTVYSVNIPVRRVKSGARMPKEGEGLPDGIMLEWDPADWDSDPSSRFPMGC
mmetsp:Transcript_37680/g.83913  ORF Transcript_37680/g.83913 Transcript_37680/m.83913 type:complete len:210 (+) Transcript_37680:193-822(+)